MNNIEAEEKLASAVPVNSSNIKGLLLKAGWSLKEAESAENKLLLQETDHERPRLT